MIGRFHVENFKCLRDVTIDFAPFTVLIGPNDSGKSSVLQAINQLNALGSTRELVFGPEYDQWVWRRDPDKGIVWDFTETTKNERFQIEFSRVINGDGFLLKNKSARVAARRVRTNPPYKFHPDALRKMAPSEPSPSLSADGSNLAAVLDAMLTGPDRASLYELERKLYETIPNLRGISAPTVLLQKAQQTPSTLKALQFVLAGNERPPVAIPADLVSDGALLLTAYLALAYGDTPEILLIEEPENGLHPSRLKMIIDLLRKVTTGEVGNRKRQIIMTTHSPLLLNYCQPEEVRIVTRDAEGATQVTPLVDVPDIKRLLEEFGIGELWYLLGEEALLKGKAP
jgi:predicted ATPase